MCGLLYQWYDSCSTTGLAQHSCSTWICAHLSSNTLLFYPLSSLLLSLIPLLLISLFNPSLLTLSIYPSPSSSYHPPVTTAECSVPCSYSTCSECAPKPNCIWCPSLNKCVDSTHNNSYAYNFPFGQCLGYSRSCRGMCVHTLFSVHRCCIVLLHSPNTHIYIHQVPSSHSPSIPVHIHQVSQSTDLIPYALGNKV